MDNITILHIPLNSRLSPDKTPVGAVREPPTTRPFQRLRDATITDDIYADRGRMLQDYPPFSWPILHIPVNSRLSPMCGPYTLDGSWAVHEPPLRVLTGMRRIGQDDEGWITLLSCISLSIPVFHRTRPP